jgi:hypothetical protein
MCWWWLVVEAQAFEVVECSNENTASAMAPPTPRAAIAMAAPRTAMASATPRPAITFAMARPRT